MSSPSPRFTGIFIPAEILEIEELTMMEQMLLAWIDALYSKRHGGCYASNEYLAQRLRVKENTVVKSLTKLRHLKLIQDVSFNGRQRVMRSSVSQYVANSQAVKIEEDEDESYAGCDLNPMQTAIKIQPSPITESKVYNTPPIPPHGGSGAKAPEKKVPPKEFSEEVKSMTQCILTAMKHEKPDYASPKNLSCLHREMDLMIRLEKRSPDKIMKILMWAIKDDFWRDKFFKPNPVLYLRKKFDQLDMKMKSFSETKEEFHKRNERVAEKVEEKIGDFCASKGLKVTVGASSLTFTIKSTRQQKEFKYLDTQFEERLETFLIKNKLVTHGFLDTL